MKQTLEDEMLDATISWCESNGINVLEPEQLSSLVNSLYVTVCDAALDTAQPKVKVIAESLYDRTGDIKDFNTVLIGRDALQELEEACAAQTIPDKCDRIVWRNKYYHLPLKESK